MPAPVAGSLETQGRFPLDYKYWVQNFTNIDDGLVSQGLLRFIKGTNELYIKLDSGWELIPTASTIGNTFSIEIGQVIQGNQAVVSNSGTLQNVVLDFMLPQGLKGDAATIQITSVTTSPDSSAHVYNDGTAYNASYRLQIPAGPKGDDGPAFSIDAYGTYADKGDYDGEAEGFTYLVDEIGHQYDGYVFVADGNGGWATSFPFKGPKGVSVYIAYATDYDGTGRSFTPTASKRYISFLNQNTQPLITDFTVWLPVTLNPSGFVTATELSQVRLGDLADIDLGGLSNGNSLVYDAGDDKWYPGVGGDMLRSTYDPFNNGFVNNSGKLEGNNSAFHLARANHTGVQDISTITNLQSSLNSKADLVGGLVPNSQLPSFVDDVIEATNFAALPATGEASKIYVTLNDNKTFRWSGSTYTEISPSIAIGTTSATAFRGDLGQTAYDHSQLTAANPHGVTKAMVGLGNADNTSDATKNSATAILTNKKIEIAYNDHILFYPFSGSTFKMATFGNSNWRLYAPTGDVSISVQVDGSGGNLGGNATSGWGVGGTLSDYTTYINAYSNAIIRRDWLQANYNTAANTTSQINNGLSNKQDKSILGYTIATTASALNAGTDTVLIALGKLEKKINDTVAGVGSYVAKAGDTMSGDLTMLNNKAVIMSPATGTRSFKISRTDTVASIFMDGTSGTSNGSGIALTTGFGVFTGQFYSSGNQTNTFIDAQPYAFATGQYVLAKVGAVVSAVDVVGIVSNFYAYNGNTIVGFSNISDAFDNGYRTLHLGSNSVYEFVDRDYSSLDEVITIYGNGGTLTFEPDSSNTALPSMIFHDVKVIGQGMGFGFTSSPLEIKLHNSEVSDVRINTGGTNSVGTPYLSARIIAYDNSTFYDSDGNYGTSGDNTRLVLHGNSNDGGGSNTNIDVIFTDFNDSGKLRLKGPNSDFYNISADDGLILQASDVDGSALSGGLQIFNNGAYLNSGIDIQGGVYIANNLGVDGDIDVYGYLNANNGLNVSGGDLNVTTSTFLGNTEINGSVQINGNLTVSDVTDFNDDIRFHNGSDTGSISQQGSDMVLSTPTTFSFYNNIIETLAIGEGTVRSPFVALYTSTLTNYNSYYDTILGTYVTREKFESLYQPGSTMITAVTSGGNTWTNGELQGTQPSGTKLGMKFVGTSWRYEVMFSSTDQTTLRWVRTAK